MQVKRLKNDELYHHGIKGQQWGVQNGPPYPLNTKKEFKNAKKYGKKWFNPGRKVGMHSKAIQQVVNADDYKKASSDYQKAGKALDDYVERYSKANKSQIIKNAEAAVRKDSKEHGWGYDERDIKAAIYENTHREDSNTFGGNSYYHRELYKLIKNDKKFKELSDNTIKAANEYKKKNTEYAEKILGKYKDEKIKTFSGNVKAKSVVSDAIEAMDSNDLFIYYFDDGPNWYADDKK